MTSLLVQSIKPPLPINLSSLIDLSQMRDVQFDEFYLANPDLRTGALLYFSNIL